MARVKDGILGAFIGTIGPLVGYLWNGRPVLRSKPTLKKKGKRKLTEKQLAAQSRLKVMCPVLNHMTDYLRIGFELEGAANKYTANNAAKSYNLKFGLKGEYPNLEVDYPALMMSKGELPVAKDGTVFSESNGLRFSWNPEHHRSRSRTTAMFIAYFPLAGRAVYKVNGAMRSEGTDLLIVDASLKGLTAETYLSFISEDHRRISDSVYFGQVVF